MPFAIRKLPKQNAYKVYNKLTGVVHSKHTTLENAHKQVALLHMIDNNKQDIVDTNGNVIGSINGDGIFDFLDPKKNGVNKTLNKVAEKVGLDKAVEKVGEVANKIGEVAKRVWNGRTGLPPKVIKILEQYGDAPISAITIDRTPVQSVLTGAMNAISLGSFSKKFSRLPYDKLFHLRLDITTSQGKFKMEKNEVINMDKDPVKSKGAEQQPLSSVPSGLTMNLLMENAKEYMGAKFIPYSAYNNNCQDFIIGVLKGSKIGNETDYTFVKQNTDSLFKNDPTLRKVANTLTDLGARVNVITSGGEGIWRGTGLMVDADDDQVLLPFLSEYMMVLPPYMIKRNNKKKGYKYKLVNPLTQERYLAKRTGKTSVEVRRKLVDKPYFVDDDNEDKPYVRDFSPEDRKLLLEYDKKVSEYEEQIDDKDYGDIPDVAFKNLERGRPLPCEGATARKKKAKVVKAKADQRKPYDNSQFEREQQKEFAENPQYYRQGYHNQKYWKASKYHNDEVDKVEQVQHTKGHIAKEKAKADEEARKKAEAKAIKDAEIKRVADIEAAKKATEDEAIYDKKAIVYRRQFIKEIINPSIKETGTGRINLSSIDVENRTALYYPTQHIWYNPDPEKSNSFKVRSPTEGERASGDKFLPQAKYILKKELVKLFLYKTQPEIPEAKFKNDLSRWLEMNKTLGITDEYEYEEHNRSGGWDSWNYGAIYTIKTPKKEELIRLKYKEAIKTQLYLTGKFYTDNIFIKTLDKVALVDGAKEAEKPTQFKDQASLREYITKNFMGGAKEKSGKGLENKISTDIIKMPNKWVSYVKDYAAKNGIKYNDALKSAECKAGYKTGGAIFNPNNDPAISAQNRVIADNMNGRSRINAFVHNKDDLAGRKFISM